MRSTRCRLRQLVAPVGATLILALGGAPGVIALAPAPGLAADADPAILTTVESPSVKLGERAVIVATLAPRDGFKITDSYRHRIRKLSALDDGVRVERKVVNGAMQDGKVVFLIEVVPTKPGTHSVVGFFRFSVHNGQQLDIKSAPFEATVTATE